MATNPSTFNELISLANQGTNLPAHLRALLLRTRTRPLHEQRAAAAEVKAWLDSGGRQTFRAAAPAPLSPLAQAQFEEGMRMMAANAAARSLPSVAPIEDAPSLVAAVNARRSGQTTHNLDAPIYGGGPRPRQAPTVNAQGGIDDPPSLTDAIQNRRTR